MTTDFELKQRHITVFQPSSAGPPPAAAAGPAPKGVTEATPTHPTPFAACAAGLSTLSELVCECLASYRCCGAFRYLHHGTQGALWCSSGSSVVLIRVSCGCARPRRHDHHQRTRYRRSCPEPPPVPHRVLSLHLSPTALSPSPLQSSAGQRGLAACLYCVFLVAV